MRQYCLILKREFYKLVNTLLTMQLNVLDLKVRIIRKLVQWRKWGGSHTEYILSGLPSHLRGGKMVRDAIRELEKSEWILPATKTGEIHYSLNPRKTEEILQFYEQYCKRELESFEK